LKSFLQEKKMMSSHGHGSCPVHPNFDPLATEFLADPFAVMASLPRDIPVFYAPGYTFSPTAIATGTSQYPLAWTFGAF
jgi:hypothetical protein